MTTLIDISSLTPRTLTRPRGAEALRQLMSFLSANLVIELSLSSKDPVSNSFLDEFVLRSSEKNVFKRIIFVIDSVEMLRKLERVFSLRLENGRYRWVNEKTVRSIDSVSCDLDDPSEEIKDAL